MFPPIFEINTMDIFAENGQPYYYYGPNDMLSLDNLLYIVGINNERTLQPSEPTWPSPRDIIYSGTPVCAYASWIDSCQETCVIILPYRSIYLYTVWYIILDALYASSPVVALLIR